MRHVYIILAVVLAVSGVFLLWTGGFKDRALMFVKSKGYMEYTPAEAQEIAYTKCKQCHPIDKVAKYCMRCGPPFIIVLHNMKKLISIEKNKPGMQWISNMSDAEAVAITQVWNALVGNWEDHWREEDLVKLLRSNIKAFNKHREETNNERLDLSDTKLQGTTLTGAKRTRHRNCFEGEDCRRHIQRSNETFASRGAAYNTLGLNPNCAADNFTNSRIICVKLKG